MRGRRFSLGEAREGPLCRVGPGAAPRSAGYRGMGPWVASPSGFRLAWGNCVTDWIGSIFLLCALALRPRSATMVMPNRGGAMKFGFGRYIALLPLLLLGLGS